jgi:hypothetical protein
LGNNSAAQLIVAQSTGAVVSGPRSMQGQLSSAVFGSVPPTGGIFSRFEDALADAQLSAGQPSQSPHLRLSTPRSTGTEVEAAAKAPDGGREHETGTGPADTADLTELVACCAAACAGPAETVWAELIPPDLTASTVQPMEASALDGAGPTIQTYLAEQAYYDVRHDPAFGGPRLGPETSVSILTKPPTTDVAGEARPTAVGTVAEQHLWPNTHPVMQSGQPFTGVRSGGALEPGGVAVGGRVLVTDPTLTPAAGWSSMAILAPGGYPGGTGGAIQHAPAVSVSPVDLVAPDGPMQVSVSIGATRVETGPSEIDREGMRLQAAADSGTPRSAQSGPGIDPARMQVNVAEGNSATPPEPREEGNRTSAGSPDLDGTTGVPQTQAPQTQAPQTQAPQAQSSHIGESEESATHNISEAAPLGQEPSDGQIAAYAADEAVATSDSPAPDSTGGLRPAGQGGKVQDLWTLSARQVHDAYEVEGGFSSRQRSAPAEQLDSVRTGQAGEIFSRQQQMSSELESSAGINEAAVRRQSIAAEPQTISANPGDLPSDRSGDPVYGAMRESAARGELGTSDTSYLNVTNTSSDRVTNISPEKATNTSSETAHNAAGEHGLRAETVLGDRVVAQTEYAQVADQPAAATRASGTQPRHQNGGGHATEAIAPAKSALREERPEQPRIAAPAGDSESIHADGRLREQRIETWSTETAAAQRTESRSVVDQIVNRVALNASAGRPTITIRLRPARLGNVEVRVGADRTGRIIANIQAETHETLRILRSSSHLLMESLREQGLRVSELRIGAVQNAQVDTGDEDPRYQFAQAQHNDGSQAGFQTGHHSYFEQHWQGGSYQPDAYTHWRGHLPEALESTDEPGAATAYVDTRPGRVEYRA